MKLELLQLLCCPQCRGELTLSIGHQNGVEVESGSLQCEACSGEFPIVRSIPRFVPAENYARNFGLQWSLFRKTQLDSHTGVPISQERLFFSTEWTPEEMARKRILDAGCGAGRFAEVALSTGAEVVAIDYSSAVDACWGNLGPHPRLHVVQADIYKLPFKRHAFDRLYCLGVLQHAPDVKRAFMSLPANLKDGGKIAVDVYAKVPLNALWPKYWLRPLTRRMDQQRLLEFVQRAVPRLLPLSDFLAGVPVVGRKLRYAVPVANHRPDYPSLSRAQITEWAVLNTYDMFSPAYDQPQSAKTLQRWFEEAGLREVKVYRRGHLIGHGVR